MIVADLLQTSASSMLDYNWIYNCLHISLHWSLGCASETNLSYTMKYWTITQSWNHGINSSYQDSS